MSDPIAPLINALHAQGRLRVWSLVITVFGDLVQDRGGEVSTARLGQLLGRVGVEQGTLRTALSRLGRDGWVTSTRSGRTSLYRLSPEGLARFAPATTRIYAAPAEGPVDSWTIRVELDAAGNEVLHLTPEGEDRDRSGDLRLTGRIEELSDAFRAKLLTSSHRHALAGLALDLDALDRVDLADPLDAAAARMLLIHRWRRIVLRYDDLRPDLMPGDAPLADPRRAVARAYRRLFPAAEAWLDSASGDMAAMPPAEPRLARRFGQSDQA